MTAKRALVTGGTRGIGRAIAERLERDGMQVTAIGSSDVDLSDRAATEAFAKEVAAMDLDVLVNNAGYSKPTPFAEIEPADFDRIQEVNVRAPFIFCRAVVPGMRARGFGRILNLSSIFGTITRAGRGAYSSSKFAIDGMTASLAVEVAADGILANCIAPGFIATDALRQIVGEAGMAEIAESVPIKRLAQPEEVAALVSWLVSDDNTYVTGQNIVIDGGFTKI